MSRILVSVLVLLFGFFPHGGCLGSSPESVQTHQSAPAASVQTHQSVPAASATSVENASSGGSTFTRDSDHAPSLSSSSEASSSSSKPALLRRRRCKKHNILSMVKSGVVGAVLFLNGMMDPRVQRWSSSGEQESHRVVNLENNYVPEDSYRVVNLENNSLIHQLQLDFGQISAKFEDVRPQGDTSFMSTVKPQFHKSLDGHEVHDLRENAKSKWDAIKRLWTDIQIKVSGADEAGTPQLIKEDADYNPEYPTDDRFRTTARVIKRSGGYEVSWPLVDQVLKAVDYPIDSLLVASDTHKIRMELRLSDVERPHWHTDGRGFAETGTSVRIVGPLLGSGTDFTPEFQLTEKIYNSDYDTREQTSETFFQQEENLAQVKSTPIGSALCFFGGRGTMIQPTIPGLNGVFPLAHRSPDVGREVRGLFLLTIDLQTPTELKAAVEWMRSHPAGPNCSVEP